MRGEEVRSEKDRPRSQGSLPGSLVVQAPNFVTSIAVVSRLATIFSSTTLILVEQVGLLVVAHLPGLLPLLFRLVHGQG